MTKHINADEYVSRVKELVRPRKGKWCCVAIDIQHFEIFNAWFGHDKGDYVISRIVALMMDFEQCEDAVSAYFGHDYFSVFLEYDKEKIQDLFNQIKTVIHSYSNSIGFMPAFGVYVLEDDEEFSIDSYNKARIAIESAKNSYTDRIKFFNKSVYNKKREEYAILSDFQAALKNNEICFYVQPQCALATGRIFGCEALARWIKADGTIIPPGVFVPVLEKYGLIPDLDKCVWEKVSIWIRSIMDQGIRPVPVCVNVSRIELITMDVPAYLYALCECYHIPSNLIKVEITESAYAENYDIICEQVQRLKDRGFTVCMDDFGAGYSSLNMLEKVNADVIKLDMGFMKNENALSRKGSSIVESIISMTKTMGVPLIVEGIETDEHIDFLKNSGALFGQGYYFYRPVEPDVFAEMIRVPGKTQHSSLAAGSVEMFHSREFLNDTLFTDSILNNILGPVAFYIQDEDGGVNITRFNQPFYDCIADEKMDARRKTIQNYIFPEDVETFNNMFERAFKNPIHGAQCTVRFKKSTGGEFWYNLRLFFLRANEQGKLFYGKIRNVTDMYSQGMAFLNLMMDKACVSVRINLTDGRVFKLDEAATKAQRKQIGEYRENMIAELVEKYQFDQNQFEAFGKFFSTERLRKSLDDGIYSETMAMDTIEDGKPVKLVFYVYYIKFTPDETDNIYVFACKE